MSPALSKVDLPHRTPIHTAQCRDEFGCGVRKRLEVGILALIIALTDLRCFIRRKEVVKWLIGEVARTQDAPVLKMLRAFTKRIMPMGSTEKPADVFERILNQVETVRSIATVEAEKASTKKKQTKESKSKIRGGGGSGSHRPYHNEQTTRGRTRRQRQNPPQNTHQTTVAGSSSGNTTEAAKEPTTAEKGVAMFQAYEAL